MFGLSNFIITEFLLIFYSLVTNVLYSYIILKYMPIYLSYFLIYEACNYMQPRILSISFDYLLSSPNSISNLNITLHIYTCIHVIHPRCVYVVVVPIDVNNFAVLQHPTNYSLVYKYL